MTVAACRRADMLLRLERARHWSTVSELAEWQHAAGSFGPDAVSYQCRRAAWRLLILAGVL